MTTRAEEKRTSVKLRISTIDMLKNHGVMGETYDDVIRRLMFVKETGKAEPDKLDEKLKRLI